MDDLLRYPIGKFTPQESHTPEEIQAFISRIEVLPGKVAKAVEGLTKEQLDTPYREGGWTVRQLIHHIPDSHMNAYIRVKWVLTESTPIIKAYDEKRWAETPDVKGDPELPLALLKALHQKWVVLLKSLGPEDLPRELFHPQSQKHISLHNLLGSYAWHGDHHLAHITSLKERMKW